MQKKEYHMQTRKAGFSLIELLIGLIIISVIMAAIAPTLNKKLKAQNTSFADKLTTKCAIYGLPSACTLCYGKENCVVCNLGCADYGKNLNISKCICE